MPRLRKALPGQVFSAAAVRDAYDRFHDALDAQPALPDSYRAYVDVDGEAWDFDEPLQFFEVYGQEVTAAHIAIAYPDAAFSVVVDHGCTTVTVQLPRRESVREVVEVVTGAAAGDAAPPSPPHVGSSGVFIGHGRSPHWRQLSDYLRQRGFEVITYEAVGRVGDSTFEVLRSIVAATTAAVMVHTPDRLDDSGRRHAGSNVIHETGLFQGRLGFERVIVVREDGCENFANLAALTELRFPQGRIEKIFGDVANALACLAESESAT